MSTKIYDGLIFKSQNFSELSKILNKLNSEIKEKAYEISVDFIAKKFVNHFDLKTNLNNIIDEFSFDNKNFNKNFYLKINESLLHTLIQLFNEKCQESFTKIERDFDFDYSLSLGIYSSSKGVLIIPYYEKAEYFNILKKYFVEYHYWNNSDRDEMLTEREWYNRGKVWNNALDKECLVYKVFNENYSIINTYKHKIEDISEKILTHIPSKEQRALNIAKNEIQLKIFKRLLDSYSVEEANNKIFSIYNESMNIFKEEKSIIETNDLKNEWIEKLEDITIETLYNYNAPKIIEKLDDFNYAI